MNRWRVSDAGHRYFLSLKRTASYPHNVETVVAAFLNNSNGPSISQATIVVHQKKVAMIDGKFKKVVVAVVVVIIIIIAVISQFINTPFYW
jgi:hypothetical protein